MIKNIYTITFIPVLIIFFFDSNNIYCQISKKNNLKYYKKSPTTIAYVEVNNNALKCVLNYNYGKHAKPLFNQVNIFSANINSDSTTHQPYLYFNLPVKYELNSRTIFKLHQKKIKVVLDVLGNHQDAGWGCFTSYNQANEFAKQCANTLKKYNLDGIDIDDEYSACHANDSSLVWAVTALRRNLGKDKFISMVIFENYQYLKVVYEGKKVVDNIDLFIEETYDLSNYDKRLANLLQLNINKRKIGLGTHLENKDQKQIAQFIKSNGLSAIMVYNVSKKDSLGKLNTISKYLFNKPLNK